MPTPLSAQLIRDLVAGPKPRTPRRIYLDGGPTGFCVVHAVSGRVTYHVAYRESGKKRFALVCDSATPPDRARELAMALRQRIDAGLPAKAPKSLPTAPGTVGELVDDYVAWLNRRGAVSARKSELVLGHLLGPVRDKLASELTRADAVTLLRPHLLRGHAPTTAQYQKAGRAAWNWAMRQQYTVSAAATDSRYQLELNPWEKIAIEGHDPGKPAPEECLWTPNQIATVWHRAMDHTMPPVGHAIRAVIAAGGQRVQSVLHSRWADLNGDTLLFRYTKSGKPHAIPVGRRLAQVLDELKAITGGSELMFPNRVSATQPVLHTSLARVVRDLRVEHGLGQHIAPRYLRATAKTALADAGVPRLSIDLLQHHAPRNLSAAANSHYDRSLHMAEKREAMAAWDQLLDQWLQ